MAVNPAVLGTDYGTFNPTRQTSQEALGPYWMARNDTQIPLNHEYRGCPTNGFAADSSDIHGVYNPGMRPMPASMGVHCDIGLSPQQATWEREMQKEASGARNPATSRYTAEDAAYDARKGGTAAAAYGGGPPRAKDLWNNLGDMVGTQYQGVK